MSILRGDGRGRFDQRGAVEVEGSPESVVVGDFNGDGMFDLALTNEGSGDVAILLGDGRGRTTAASNFNAGEGYVRVAVGDFNGDGKPDLAAANAAADSVSILLNNCGTTPAPPWVGSCDGDSELAVNEIVTLVNLTLIVQAVNNGTKRGRNSLCAGP